MTAGKRAFIVGGVAGGASCAARLAPAGRADRDRTPGPGALRFFCELRLAVLRGNVIQDEAKLLVATPELFRKRFNIEVRTQNEVTSIDRSVREIEVRDLVSGRSLPRKIRRVGPVARGRSHPATASRYRPARYLHTAHRSRQPEDSRVDRCRSARSAVVVGGGFIGLEMAENLVHRGMEVTIVEMANQLMPPLDPEMAEFVHQRLKTRGVRLQLGDAVAAFEAARKAYSPSALKKA